MNLTRHLKSYNELEMWLGRLAGSFYNVSIAAAGLRTANELSSRALTKTSEQLSWSSWMPAPTPYECKIANTVNSDPHSLDGIAFSLTCPFVSSWSSKL